MRAITRSRPLQLRQVCTSIQKTRLARDAQFLVRCLSVTVLCIDPRRCRPTFRLNRLYMDWFQRYNLSSVLRLETDRLDWLIDLVDRVNLFRKIERYLE